MTASAPWWASDGASALDQAQDPLRAHLAARGLDPGEATGADEREPTDDLRRRARAADEAATRRATAGHASAGPGTAGQAGGHAAQDGADGEAGARGAAAGDHPLHDPAICGACPICRGYVALRERHPEVAGHVAEAARHLALALATFADLVDDGADRSGAAAGEAGARQRAGSATAKRRRATCGDTFTDIPLDDPPDGGS